MSWARMAQLLVSSNSSALPKSIGHLERDASFLTGMMALPVIFSIFPLISLVAQKWGMNAFVWGLLGLILLLAVLMDMAYGAIFMYITASPPTKSALGATHGLSQTSASIARAIGPAMSTSLFSLSVQENWLGGYAVYLFFGVLSLGSLVLARQLPEEVWEEAEEEDD